MEELKIKLKKNIVQDAKNPFYYPGDLEAVLLDSFETQ
jgi:hypothetical protein